MTENRMEPPAHPYGPPHDEGFKSHLGSDHAVHTAPIDDEISTRGVIVFTAWMGAITLAALVLMWFLLRGFLRAEVASDPVPGPLAAEIQARAALGPPDPRLQRAPILDMGEMRRHEDERLGGYGWVDESAKIARIPIDRAVELVAKSGHARPVTGATP